MLCEDCGKEKTRDKHGRIRCFRCMQAAGTRARRETGCSIWSNDPNNILTDEQRIARAKAKVRAMRLGR